MHVIYHRIKMIQDHLYSKCLKAQSGDVDGDGQVVSPNRANSRRYAISFALLPGKGFRGSRKVSSQGG